ncbi:Alpha/Beta hydrolase protein [Xylaria cf. heliscus]|nr:Alpha/Beta hydrolase protein [Xylaria cf. heliscus]
MASVRPFKIHVADAKIERLRQKLALNDLPDEDSIHAKVEKSSVNRGPSLSDISRLVDTWRTSYDWRKAEARLNEFPQFVASVDIDGFGTYDIHHIHKRSTVPNSVPLLYLHGWPGCFLEGTKIINDLAQGDGVAGSRTFHVVVPSLIDFGFSSRSGVVGFSFEQHAEAYDKLMSALGYNEYVIQGGDVGLLVGKFMAKKYGPSRCKAYHTNTPVPKAPTPETFPELAEEFSKTPLSDSEKESMARAGQYSTDGMAYFKLMATRPVTIGYSLRDSPVGMLAWIYEKLVAWTDRYPWTDEEILTWVSIYYFSTPGPDASANVYYAMEHSSPPVFDHAAEYVDVPFGVARFPNDILVLPKLWNRTLGPLVFESEYEKGGHFAAWERPDAIIGDLRKMFADNGPAYESVRLIVSAK